MDGPRRFGHDVHFDLFIGGPYIIAGIPDGDSVWKISEFSVAKVTSGEPVTLIVFGDTAGDPVGVSSTITFAPGDSLTFSAFVIVGAEPYDGFSPSVSAV